MLAFPPLFVSIQGLLTALFGVGIQNAPVLILLVFFTILAIFGATGAWIIHLRREADHLRAVLAARTAHSTLFRVNDAEAELLETTEADRAHSWPDALVPVFTRTDFEALFEGKGASISAAVTSLFKTGIRFTRITRLADGTPVQVKGRPVGITAEIEVEHPTEETGVLFAEAARAGSLEATAERAERRLASVPLAMAELDPMGAALWTNQRFTELSGTDVLSDDMLAIVADPPEAPVIWPGALDAQSWVRAKMMEGEDGVRHLSLAPAGEEVAARESLQKLMNTLADTFAHLSVGLAVFGQKQSLTMFNPALAALFDLDPVGLAKQPSLRAFLDALRQHRRLPEMRSFTEWRDALLRLGQTGHPGSYREDWTLPSGKVIGVTARHYTGGALVFMFEDISTQIMLERRYRQEMETSQTTLDCLEDGIVVFNNAGSLIFANTAFERIWDIESMQTLGAPSIKQLVAHMAARSDCADVWVRLGTFVQSADTRVSWTAEIPMLEGPSFKARFTTLPDGSAIAIFSTAHTTQGTPLDDDFSSPPVPNGVRIYLEDRFGKSAKGLQPAAVLPEGLPNDLALVAMLAAVDTPDEMDKALAGTGTIERVAALMNGLGFDVDLEDWPVLSMYEHWNVTLRQIVWSLALTASHSAVPGSRVKLAGTLEEGWIRLTFSIRSTEPIVAEHARFSGRTLLQKLVQDLGGNLVIEDQRNPDLVTFRFGLPIYVQGSGPEITRLKIVS